ncbi:hypothetical protein G5I_01287 [Acromyrmex echinatior]|uniref:Uncharacterized protein n=1 Tax=Acromyrmex echinatior TaxID=103372 RepID=F4W778_ACREC|nr:hypothetical protein G5I_01287 [Acromyrmex echinatior]
MACAGGPKNGIVNVMEVVLRPLMALCWNKQCEKLNNAVLLPNDTKWLNITEQRSQARSPSKVLESFCIPAMTRIKNLHSSMGRIYVVNVRNKWFTYDHELSRFPERTIFRGRSQPLTVTLWSDSIDFVAEPGIYGSLDRFCPYWVHYYAYNTLQSDILYRTRVENFAMEKKKDAYRIISPYLLRRVAILTCLSQQLVVSTAESSGMYLYIRSLHIIPHGGGGSSRFRVALAKGHRYSGIHANRLFPELPSAHCALAEKSKKVRAIPRCPMPRPPLPPYLFRTVFQNDINRHVCRKFCLHKWNAPFRTSTSLDRPVECYFRMEFSNYSPSPRASCNVAADSLYSEKYHLKKIPLEVAKGTISPNLATVRPYHSNKHSVAREDAKKRGETQLLFITSKNCYKDKEFLNAAKLATSRSCRSWQILAEIIICDLADENQVHIDITSRRKYADFNNRYYKHEKFLLVLYVHVKYRNLIQKMRKEKESFRKARKLRNLVFRRSTSGYEFSYRVNLHVQENTLEQLNILQVRKRADRLIFVRVE